MINSSDAVEFTPIGRNRILNHPENRMKRDAKIDKNIHIQAVSNEFLDIDIEKSNDFWSLRVNKENQEEELYCYHNLAIYSKGKQDGISSQTSFCCESKITHALWCTFYVEDKYKSSKTISNNLEKIDTTSVDCICLFDTYTMNVHTENGENYVSSLPFKVCAVWPTKYGILVEKAVTAPLQQGLSTMDTTKHVPESDDSDLPIMHSLSHPLDDTRPVLIKHGNSTYLWQHHLKIIFTSLEPSFAFVYDTRTGSHSIYKIRKITKEEELLFPHQSENISTNISTIPSFYITETTFGMKKTKRTASSPFYSRTSHTTNCSANVSFSSQHLSRSHSPMATISRCQSPTNPMFSGMNNSSIACYPMYSKTHQAILATSSGPSEHSDIILDGRNNQYSDYMLTATIKPELCLEHVWTENPRTFKDGDFERASKVFLTTDLLGQVYFCYLIRNQSRLFLARIEKSNDPNQIILGMLYSVTAKDAISLQELKMIVVIETNNNISLFSGMSLVGKLHIPSNTHNIIGNTSLSSNLYSQILQSPYPRRSSLISPTKSSTPELRFDEGVHLLSPVQGTCSHNVIDYSFYDGSNVILKNTILNKIIIECGSCKYFKISLPIFKASPLVSKCLQTLQSILPREIAMQLLIKWYVARNAPGPEDLTLNQEWHLFLVIFFTLFGYDVSKLYATKSNDSEQVYEYYNSPNIVSKKQKTIKNGTVSDWLYMIMSDCTNYVDLYINDVLGLKRINTEDTVHKIVPEDSENMKIINNIESTYTSHLPIILFSLHLLYEEMKMHCNMSENIVSLAKLLHQISGDLKLSMYQQRYVNDFPVLYHTDIEFQFNKLDLDKIIIPNFISSNVPNIFEALYSFLTYSFKASYPYLDGVNTKSRNIIILLSLFSEQDAECILELDHYFKKINSETKSKTACVSFINDKNRKIEDITRQCYDLGFNKKELDNSPFGLNFVIRSIIYQCRERPPTNWPYLIYDLIDRQDLAALIKEKSSYYPDHIQNIKKIINHNLDRSDAKDGMNFDYTILRLRFNTDHRVREIRKLLDSSEPMIISIVQRPDVSDHEFIEEQEKFLHALCTRTMALPIGRGMFTLRTSMPINTEQLPIPRLCLTGKAPPRGTTVELTHIDVPPNMNLWPLFHNGVATGLCIHPSALNVDSTWIVYNKQHQSELGIEHSGFLMALGLNGHLKNLAPFSMSSMDVSMTKLLSLHVETLLPPTSIELNVQQNVQVAALMGVGLVYQKTSHRHIAYALLSEIGRPPGPEMKNCVDRESYSLTAGLALGLVVLCSGGGSDLAGIPDTLHYYMIGGNTRPFGGAQKDKYKSPSYQIKEGDSINVDITSPGATLALGLMYLQTGNRPVADWMTAPDTNYLLDFVRPDFLLLRILAKSLILWNEIEPSKTWVSSHVPDIVAKYKLQKPSSNQEEQIDWETINQAYCNIIAGGCMALGIRFAGTENMIAFKTLYHFLKMFMTLTQKSMADLLGRATIESCLNVVLLSASLVMAGTGNLELIRVCRHIRERVGPTNSVVTYGSHVATHMALGFLVLGGGAYTLSNDPTSVAALIISLFPKFPIHSNDNRYHLQALRHFYVLATQPRLLLPKDIDTKQFCYVNVRLTFESISQKEGQKIILKAPCLLPQLDRLNKIEVDDDRYWRIIFEKGRNFDQLTKILEDNCVLDVKQRAGCLSRVEDPQGFRTLLAQTLTTDDVIVWTASLKQITSFTTDSIMLYFVDSFLKKHDSNDFMQYDRCCKNIKHKKLSAFCINKFNKFTIEKLEFDSQLYQIRQDMSYIENRYLQNLIIIAYECVIRDKISLLPLWFDIYKSAISLKVKANPSLIWQIKFLCLPSLYKDYCSDLERLINIENILANKQQISLQMDSWESDLSECLSQWVDFEHSKISIQNIERIIGYKINYDVPSSQCTIIKRLEYPIDGPTMSCLKVYGTLKYNSFFKFG
ncbi:anaphase-promoting complex subunit 1 isoform X2 [Phymastichus coffea]|uniref:anaphase-promoting complex subunit 1 isoform X2 n=1 Tax=Phymastichus coffea TaxID=108790 RepID=UPI00273AAF5C|nr:anaphase-promoting complex subunit 1 isoform X2 [Phymastichus coffea]